MTEPTVTPKIFAARRVRKMIGQQEAWQKLRGAVNPGDRSFQVVLLQAEGGMGKTRMLEEVLLSRGREVRDYSEPGPPEMAALGDPVVGDLIDVIDTRLHDRYRFVTALRKSLKPYRGSLDFADFDAADDVVKVLEAGGSLLDKLTEAEETAVEKFISDLEKITAKRRVVFLIDTVERLSYEYTEWLIDNDLLTSKELEIRTHHWLRWFIRGYGLGNVTIVLAGRGREGKEFFSRIRAAAVDCANCVSQDIALQHLTMNETRAFFAQLEEDWHSYEPKHRTTAETYGLIADPKRDQHKVIALYTNGVPVRLALYAQVIAQGKSIPPAFRLSFEEACRRAEVPPAEIDPDRPLSVVANATLRRIQWQIEEQFVNLLFVDPTDPHAAVLRELVRAPLGLTAEQLLFALEGPEKVDAQPDQKDDYSDIVEWQSALHKPQSERTDLLRELLGVLKKISGTFLGKRRTSLAELEGVVDEAIPEAATFRLGLQDEIYRIYAEHMGLFANSANDDEALDYIRKDLTEEEIERYTQNRIDERDARKQLYHKLARFAGYRYEHQLAAKRAYLRGDEERFEERFRLEDPNTFRFPLLNLRPSKERLDIHTALKVYEIERMVYLLLDDLERNLNSEYITLEDDNDKAARQEEDFWAQAEMWRVIKDNWLMKFIDLRDREPIRTRQETPLDVLIRVVEQENVSRWIKRFVLRGNGKRAVEFGESVEATIRAKPCPEGEDPTSRQQRNVWKSWNHTLAAEERNVWVQVARIRQGEEVERTIESVQNSIHELEKLYFTPVSKPAGTKRDPTERGFAEDPEDPAGYPEHPAISRLRRLLSHTHNALGYGHRVLGNMHEAVENYGKALEYIRPDRGILQAHRGKVLNNLARALSELGWNSIGVCLDGLDIRKELAEEVPLAGSYNTLALIYDDMGRYEDAPLLSAKAIAYCHRANESRQLGLAKRQMAESLRHVADHWRTGQRVGGSPGLLFEAAENLLREARSIFNSLNDNERLVEVTIELGSLYRDRIQNEPGGQRSRMLHDYYSEALGLLDTAERRAKNHGMAQHILDAHINLARVHYYADHPAKALEILTECELEPVYQSHRITADKTPDANDNALRNRNWVFRYLGAAQITQGWIALDRFHARVEEIRREWPDDSPATRQARVAADPVANDALHTVARAYSLAVTYTGLYSPHSRSIGTMQDDFYRKLKKSNRTELESLNRQLDVVQAEFPLLESPKMLQLLLREFFGPKLEVSPVN